MPTYDSDAAKRTAAGIQQRLNESVAAIRANKSLTPEGKRRELALATLAARRNADRGRQEHAAEREKQLATARRIAFGSLAQMEGADALSVRDAADRAAKITNPDAAKSALSNAILTDDRVFAKAVAAHAHSRGWSTVAAQYGDEYGVRSFIDDLDDIPSGPKTELADQIVWRVAPPTELRGYSDPALQQIADAVVAPTS